MSIKVRDLKKRFDDTQALKGISFDVEEGEIFGLLGPNGAGKTTTVKVLATMLLPDSGEAEINGMNVVKKPKKIRDLVDVITARDKFYRRLDGYQNIKFFSSIYEVSGWKEKMKEYGERLGLDEKDFEKKLADYSTGMRQKLNLIRNLIRKTPILFLDEPTLGLDPVSSRKFRALLKEVMEEEEKTVIFTSHNMYEVEELCERIAIMNDGKITMRGAPKALKDEIFPKRMIEFSYVDGSKEPVFKNEFIDKVETDREKVRVIIQSGDGEHVHEVIQEILDSGKIRNLSVKEPTLEEAFIRHTEDEVSVEEIDWT
ncbi:MAG: ATP-binding cassette domain-containing protein [Candidatus Natronoplasma sp.]